MNVLWRYEMSGELTSQNAGYSMWGFAKYQEKDYFVKQFLSPKYPANDSVSNPDKIRQKIARCDEFVQKKRRIYQAVNQCSDGNDIRISEFFRVDSRYYISMEKINALPWTINDVFALDEKEKRRLCASIAHSVGALHQGRIIHADIKHDNILFEKNAKGIVTAKITDFDSAFLETEQPADGESVIGDFVYFSPEIYLRDRGEHPFLSCKMDVFALGVLFHQYFTGELPLYDQATCTSVGEAVSAGKEVKLSDKLPEDIAALLTSMLSLSPEGRPTAYEVFDRIRSEEVRQRITEAKNDFSYVSACSDTPPTREMPTMRFCSECGKQFFGTGIVCDSCSGAGTNTAGTDGGRFFFAPTDL